jgi:uncharacterized membrane protein YphA (DoxX/SURF4 family)
MSGPICLWLILRSGLVIAMWTFLLSPYLLLFARLCVGGVFLASGIGKLLDREGTAASMARYPFLPAGFGRLVANVLPPVELVVGTLLVLGLFTRLTALAAAALFVVFTVMVIYDLTQGKDQSCHCFGRMSDEKLTPVAVARNVALLLLALLVADDFDGWLSLDAALGTHSIVNALPTPVDGVPVILLALATVGIIVLGGQAVNMVRTTLRGLGFR